LHDAADAALAADCAAGRATADATTASAANPATTAINPDFLNINSLLWDRPPIRRRRALPVCTCAHDEVKTLLIFHEVFAGTLRPLMRWAVQSGDAPLFGRERGCEEFEQRLLRFDAASEPFANEADDEVLYVLDGRGTIEIGGETAAVEEGAALWAAAGTTWRVADADGLELLSVLVREPVEGDGERYAIVGAEESDEGAATAGRHFRLLSTPERGCASVTQFIGLIPVGRAPDHFHRYDEVIYVLDGEGELHIEGETAPLRSGTCVHLPKGLVHCLENTGDGEMRVLGVFRPAGSPAEAYYPDGTKAQY
jgi:quercetin dioxygenase-like cupin family protein